MDMIKNKKKLARVLTLLVAIPLWAVADMEQNTINSYHAPISHCYHWLNEKGRGYLSKKYRYAQKNNGSVTFYTTPGTSNGAVAGPGLYCAKSPVGSYSYGDRVIRLDFVDDIVLYDAKSGRKFCGHNGKYYPSQSECNKKSWDIKFYHGGGKGNIAWYVIRNPQAIAQWSSNSKQVESDLLLNKKFAGNSFKTHADQTIRAMKAERSRMGELVVINHKARMNLVDLLNDPEEAKEIPPLNLIARVLRYQGRDLSKDRKKKIYAEQASRALRDIYLDYRDIEDAIKGHTNLQEIFAKAAVETVANKDLHKSNVVASYLVLDKYAPEKISRPVIAKIWQAVFKSDNVFAPLAEAKISEPLQVDEFYKNLPSREAVSKIKIQNQQTLLALLDQFTDDDAKKDKAMPYVYEIFGNYLTQSIDYFEQAYATVTNPKLEKASILAGLFQALYANRFAGMDPVRLGTILEDHLAGNVQDSDAQNWKDAIAALELPTGAEETYKLLGKYNEGKLKLPSFFDEKTYLTMLFDRSLREQSAHATPTNTFRMILSGYYEVFHDRIVSAKGDNAKAAEQNKAESFFLHLANKLSGDEAMAYVYPILQNASYFSLNPNYPGSLRYRGHPMERYVDRYNTGDANFDQMLEDLTAKSLDGSYLHYLSYEGLERNDSNALSMLSIMLDTLASDAFDNFRSTNMYGLSNAEKEKWDNYIFNSHIANAGRNRAKSDFCGISETLSVFQKQIFAYVGAAQATKLKALIDEGKNNNCY